MASNQKASSEIDIEASIKAQAKVRLVIGLPMMLIWAITIWYRGLPDGLAWVIAACTVAISHILYAFVASFLAKRLRPFSAEQLAMGTAILDPMMLSGWLSMMGEAAGLYICFYLFTILGFGFRIGPRLMRVCQIASIVGLAGVIAAAPIWRHHPILGLSYLMILIVVPLYATSLLKKLHEARAHAEHESKAKSDLLAKVSHELRTPLSGIVAAAQLISAETEDDRISRRADTIMGLSKDLLHEINDLLDSAKYKAKALVLESALFDLNDVTERIRLTLGSTAMGKGIDLNIDLDERIQDRVQGDSHYLSRVLINLAGNAVKFTEKGKVDVTVKLLEEHTEDYRIRFSVQDTGIGIPHELQQKIFEPFFQASAGTTRQFGGTGLGMTICKEVVSLMGSDIYIESEPGKGSLFYFDVTMSRVSKARQEDLPTVNIPATVYGKRVLIADDNVTNLTLIKELLERDRHEVTTARTGVETVDILSSHDFDVVFLDYNMGDMDGNQVLQIYRFGKLNAAPVYFLTADATETTADKLHESGAAGVLHKPITSEGLRQAIAQVTANNSETAAVQSKSVQSALRAVSIQYIDHKVVEELRAISERPEFLGQVLGDAAEDIERNCNRLLQALTDENVAQVHDTAHALKGVCASVGAARLASLSGKLMRLDRWELKQSSERWRVDIAEAKNQSIATLRNIVTHRTATP